MHRAHSDRLQSNFADVLRRQALEATELALEAQRDPDVREALTEMLARVRDTARALALESVEQAAATAARSVEEGNHAVDAVERLLEECRALEGIAPVLRPVIVVAASPDNDARLRAQSEGLAVSVQVVHTAEEALRRARRESPAALVLPDSQVEAARQAGGELRGLPIYAYGDSDDLEARLRAARAGATGFLPFPLELRDAIPRIRHRLTGDSPAPFRVLLVDPDHDGSAALSAVLADDDVQVAALTDGAWLLAALDEAIPDLIVLSLQLASPAAVDLVQVLRGHHRFGDLPRLLLADSPQDELRALFVDADAVIRRDTDVAILRTRIRAILERSRRERLLRAVDLSTGALTRAALLRAADREIATVRRTKATLAVARVDIEHALELRGEYGAAAVDAGLRHVAAALRGELRETDLVGHLGANGFAALLPACPADKARERLAGVRERYAARVADDPRLAGTALVTGVADTTDGVEDVLLRADRDLLLQRSRG
ncbi:MAG: GGDEF domain-containing protein [Myxococcota bacterium]